MDDKDLLIRAARGDEAAFAALIDRYGKLVYGVAYHMVGEADAEDAAQEAFIRAFKNIRACRGNFKSWVCAIARNACLDMLRKRKPALSLDAPGNDEMDVFLQIPDDAPTPEQELLAAERAEYARRAVLSLKLAYREAVVFVDIYGFAYEEAAAALNLPLGTLKSRVNRARAGLKKYLAAAYGTGTNDGA